MTVIIIVITVLITSILWFIYYNNKLKHISQEYNNKANELINLKTNLDYKINHEVIQKTKELNDLVLSLKQEIIKTEKESYFKGRNEVKEEFKNDYKIIVNPYKRTFNQKKDGLIAFGSIEKIEIGYQYQLFIKGAPALSPAYITLETHETKNFQLNEEAIKKLINFYIKDNIESAGSLIQLASNIISVK